MGAVLTAAGFGLQHVVFALTISSALAYAAGFFLWGLGARLLYQRQGRLVPLVIAHFISNLLSAVGKQVGGNIQVFQNGGGVTISDNTVNGNLQCKENYSVPVGGNNTVQGIKEDQSAGL